jgi:two-component system, cell cycle sensor histidine kinase and response regulator CckA
MAWLTRWRALLAPWTARFDRTAELEGIFRQVAEHFPDHVAVYDRQCRRIYVNPVMSRALNQELAAAVGQTPRQGHPEGGFGEYEARLRQVLDTGRSSEMELILSGVHGPLTFCHVRFAALRDAAGVVVGAVAVGRDTTRQRLEGDELRKLWFAVEQSPVSILITDSDGAIEYVNEKFTETTGFGRDDVLGKNPRILKSGKMAPEIYVEMWRSLAAGQTWRGELQNRKKGGELFWERASISPVHNAQGTVTHYVAVKEDITEHKALEAAFRQAQKMEAFGQLTAGVAHDFNNLLTVILSCVETLNDDVAAGAPAQPGLIDEIRGAGQRAADLTRQLLAIARKQVMAPRPLDLDAVVRGCEKLLRRVLGENIELAVTSQQSGWTVRCDPGQIEQALLNLAVNARDAMPNGGRLTIETTNVEMDDHLTANHPLMHGGSYVRMTVRDTGLGMSPEARTHAFEPFFTTKPHGTGLGLATVYGIVKQSEGHIFVESDEGHGTTFELYFPRTLSAMVAAPVALTPASHGTETVLLVEDDAQVRQIGVRSLQTNGYRVLVASNGAEALAVAERDEGALDLLLTDVIMPGLNGRELASELRRKRPQLRVLYMSGYTQDVLSQAGAPDSGVELLVKPFTATQLQKRVREVLDAGR